MIHVKHLLRNMSLIDSTIRLEAVVDDALIGTMRHLLPDVADNYPAHMWVEGEPEFEAIVARVRQQLIWDINAIYIRSADDHIAMGHDPYSGLVLVSYVLDDGDFDDWEWGDNFDPLDCNPVARCLTLGLGQDRTKRPWVHGTVADGYARGDITANNYTVTTSNVWTQDNAWTQTPEINRLRDGLLVSDWNHGTRGPDDPEPEEPDDPF